LELSSPGGGANSSLVSPNLVEQAKSSFGQSGSASGSASNGFIDSTPYSLGATDNPSVVLSERSTGCETVMQPGQTVPSSLCGGNTGDWRVTSSYGGATSSGDMSLGVVYGGRVTPSGKDFYNLTIRPAARISSAAVSFLFPLSIPSVITSAFGWRVHPVMGESRFHTGTDLGAPQGTPVLAAFAGKVAVADFMGGYGLAVVLQHQNGTEETLYGHMSEIFVKPGETVKQGDVIGRVGSTGLSTGPHLHFEFRKQTPNGWVVMDAGGAIDSALQQFVSALKLGITYPPQLALIRSASFTKALEMAEAKPEKPPEVEPVELPRQGLEAGQRSGFGGQRDVLDRSGSARRGDPERRDLVPRWSAGERSSRNHLPLVCQRVARAVGAVAGRRWILGGATGRDDAIAGYRWRWRGR
jgi:murein DD-endopeptidase MepM/ murein hydrolase activator NlpD